MLSALLVLTLCTGATADEVARLDKTITALASAPDTVGRLGVLRALTAAHDRWEQRQAMVKALDPGQAPPEPTVDIKALEQRLAKAQKALRVRIEGEGPALGMREAVITQLRTLGYDPKETSAADADVLVRADTELSAATWDGTLYQVQATITFELMEVSRNRPFKRFREIYRYGGIKEEDAHRRAVEELAKRVDERAVDRIDRAIRGRPDAAK